MNLDNWMTDWLALTLKPGTWLELALLLASVVGGVMAARLYYRLQGRLPDEAGDSRARSLGRGSLRRLTFPLATLILVSLARLGFQLAHVKPVLLPLAGQLLVAMALIRMAVFALRHSFSSAAWLAASERFVSLIVWATVALDMLGILPQIIELLEQVQFSLGHQKLSLWTLLQACGTVLLTVVMALWLGGLLEERLSRAESLDTNLKVVFSRLTKALLMLMAVLTSLSMVGMDLTTLSVFGGALGVGLGLGLQKIASNYVSGFIILLDRSIRIGDVIAIGNDRGQVTQITTRYTVLKSVTGVEAIVPNEMLVGAVVLNESYTNPKVRVALPVQVAYGADVEQAMAILAAAARAHERVLADPEPKAFLASFGDSGINLELGFWISDSHIGTIEVRSRINQAILTGFREAGISIPFPQREVRMVGGGV